MSFPVRDSGAAPTAGHGEPVEHAESGRIADDHRHRLVTGAHDCAALPHRALFALLRVDDVDGAIACGLADFKPCATCATRLHGYDADARDAIVRRDALLAAWSARDRHLARAARLARRAAERAKRRTAAPTTAGTPAPLPPAAAAALARAKARAAARRTS